MKSELKTYQLEEIALNICDGVHNTVIDDENGDCLLLSAKNIQNGRIIFDDTDRKINRELCDKLKKRTHLSKNDIAITTVGANVGDLAIIGDGSENYEFQRSVGLIKTNTAIADSIYLFYLLGTKSFNYFFHVIATGSAQPCLFLGTLNKIKVTLPALSKQKRIASILSAYDNLIENNNKRIKILEQMAENLYKEWFVRFRFPGHETTPIKNGIPKGWEVKKIKDCVKRLPFNQTYKANELEPEGKVIVVDQSADAYIGFHNNEPSHKANVESPILLFGDHSCKFVLMIKDFSLGENIVPFVSVDDNWLDRYYLFFATHKIIETTEYKRHWGQFVSMKIIVPPMSLQQKFSDSMKPIYKEYDELFVANQNLIKQRDLLLPRLMSGKLAV